MRRTRRASGLAGLAVLALVATGCSQGGNVVTIDVQPSLTAVPTDANAVPETFDGVPDVVGTAATDLTTPWGLDFLPNGVAVVTERTTGRILLITPPEDGSSEGTVTDLGSVEGLVDRGDGGLLGVAVSPDFATDQSLFFYESTRKDNRIVRMSLTDAGLGTPTTILDSIPHGRTNNGGRLKFGPDGFLYVGTGDAGKPALAQKPKALAGKILRITPDGKPAPGNPSKSSVWARGFRDVLGLAFDGTGQLWATDAGPHQDELDRILPGDNAGWPRHEGEGGPKHFVRPLVTWAPARATPGALAFAGGYLWLTGVAGQNLWRIKAEDGQAGDTTPYFSDGGTSTYGALRAVALAPDGRLWLATDNTDRATRKHKAPEGDDRVLLIRP
jgi:glucose/arabinose dehydrogenase